MAPAPAKSVISFPTEENDKNNSAPQTGVQNEHRRWKAVKFV
jgi:hypothetical protein